MHIRGKCIIVLCLVCFLSVFLFAKDHASASHTIRIKIKKIHKPKDLGVSEEVYNVIEADKVVFPAGNFSADVDTFKTTITNQDSLVRVTYVQR